jgi:hypothetical protein
MFTQNWTRLFYDIILGLVYILISIVIFVEFLVFDDVSFLFLCMLFLISTTYILFYSFKFELIKFRYLHKFLGKIIVFTVLEILYIAVFLVSFVMAVIASFYLY